ncbi:MAG: radical SAM protein [Patescibacteria group bacterium]
MNPERRENLARRPHLRVVVTPFCNFKCTYCRPGGEGYFENTDRTLPRKELIDIISLCGDTGFKDVKITGGEPLIRKDIVEIVRDIKNLNKFEDLEMVTNGSLLVGKAKILKEAGLDALTVSLDSANRNNFLKISRSDNFIQVVRGIEEAVNAGLKTRINTVMSYSNRDQLFGLIRIAEKMGADLKIIDLMDINSDIKSWGGKDWNKEYLNLDYVRKELKDRIVNITTSYPPGGLGSPMPTLILDSGVKVLLRDATVGTNYDSFTCAECQHYPCQDALISLRLTHDGFLKKCLIRNDNLVDVITPLRNGDIEEAKNRIRSTFNIFMRSEYIPNAWKPNNK